MKELVLDELKQRSEGTKINVCYLSSRALNSSSDIVTEVYWFDEAMVEAAEQKRSPLVVSGILVEETVQSVKGCLAEHQGENPNFKLVKLLNCTCTIETSGIISQMPSIGGEGQVSYSNHLFQPCKKTSAE